MHHGNPMHRVVCSFACQFLAVCIDKSSLVPGARLILSFFFFFVLNKHPSLSRLFLVFFPFSVYLPYPRSAPLLREKALTLSLFIPDIYEVQSAMRAERPLSMQQLKEDGGGGDEIGS